MKSFLTLENVTNAGEENNKYLKLFDDLVIDRCTDKLSKGVPKKAHLYDVV